MQITMVHVFHIFQERLMKLYLLSDICFISQGPHYNILSMIRQIAVRTRRKLSHKEDIHTS